MTEKEMEELISDWLGQLRNAWNGFSRAETEEMERLCRTLVIALHNSGCKIDGKVTEALEVISRSGARMGLTPSAIARLVLSLRSRLPKLLPGLSGEEQSAILDTIAIYTFEVYARSREQVIQQQKDDLMELSTPIIILWEGILAVPLIGTLDSRRTQDVMERLLTAIVNTKAKVVILDITGVPTVDTLVANYIMKTAAASRLLGAQLIITGISPAVAQTVVHLGVDLSGMITRAVMADGVELAFDILGKLVVTAGQASYKDR